MKFACSSSSLHSPLHSLYSPHLLGSSLSEETWFETLVYVLELEHCLELGLDHGHGLEHGHGRVLEKPLTLLPYPCSL